MHNNTPIVPYISLCSGYEGIGLGLHRCIPNLRCISYCEREAYAIANLVAKMEKGLLDAAPVFTDVTTFPWEQFAPYMAGGILSFGWPCQPVSMAGKRKATEDERWLFDIIADGISILKPGMLFAENVEGLLSAKMPDGSLVFSHCIERLERLHYKVEAGIFSASEVGTPHQRKRVFIMAHNNSERVKEFNRGIAVQSLSTTIGDCCIDTWPSRPGEQQYAWEPPRVTTGLENSNSSRGKEPKHQQANLPTEPSGCGAEAVGNASQREDYGRESRDMGQASSEWRCGNNAFDYASEAMGNAESRWTGGCGNKDSERERLGSSWASPSGDMGDTEQLLLPASREHRAMEQAGEIPADREWRESAQADPESSAARKREGHGSNAAEFHEIESSVGRNADEPSVGVDISELSGISNSELAEIREWMVKTDNRTDELRLLGNGVVPATATRAFLTLFEKLK